MKVPHAARATYLCAYRAVLVQRPLDAYMVVLEARIVAASAAVTMEEILPAAHAAYSTLLAVKLLFARVVVEEAALEAAARFRRRTNAHDERRGRDEIFVRESSNVGAAHSHCHSYLIDWPSTCICGPTHL